MLIVQRNDNIATRESSFSLAPEISVTMRLVMGSRILKGRMNPINRSRIEKQTKSTINLLPKQQNF